MAISVPHVRGALLPLAAAPARAGTTAPVALRRAPLTALLAGALAVVQAVGLLAVALTGLDGLLAVPTRPGPPAVVGVLGLAGWIVLAAGTGAALIDGAGRRGYVGLALAETGLVGVLAVLAATTPIAAAVAGPVPLPVAVLLAAALPVAKLLLAGAPAARRWVSQGPRPREIRPDPVATHRVLATLTLGVIGAALVALAVLAPVASDGAGPDGTVSTVVHRP